MNTISQDLFQLAGLFAQYQRTGGSFTADEAATLSGKLMQLAEGTAAQEKALRGLADEFDRYIEDQRDDRLAGVVNLSAHRGGLQLIEGGRA